MSFSLSASSIIRITTVAHLRSQRPVQKKQRRSYYCRLCRVIFIYCTVETAIFYDPLFFHLLCERDARHPWAGVGGVFQGVDAKKDLRRGRMPVRYPRISSREAPSPTFCAAWTTGLPYRALYPMPSKLWIWKWSRYSGYSSRPHWKYRWRNLS